MKRHFEAGTLYYDSPEMIVLRDRQVGAYRLVLALPLHSEPDRRFAVFALDDKGRPVGTIRQDGLADMRDAEAGFAELCRRAERTK